MTVDLDSLFRGRPWRDRLRYWWDAVTGKKHWRYLCAQRPWSPSNPYRSDWVEHWLAYSRAKEERGWVEYVHGGPGLERKPEEVWISKEEARLPRFNRDRVAR